MAVSNIQNKPLTGPRLIDGSLINQIIDNVQALTANGFAGSRSLNSNSLSVTVAAVTNSDFTLAIPSGALIRSMAFYTTTAFTAVTDAMISIGNAAGGAQYVAAVSVKAVGVYSLALVAASAPVLANFTLGTVFVRIAQSGGNTAVGAGVLVVSYDVPS